MNGSYVNGHRVDESKGHVALNWSLYGLQETMNGNDLLLKINPNTWSPNMNRILTQGGFWNIRVLIKIFSIRERLVTQAKEFGSTLL